MPILQAGLGHVLAALISYNASTAGIGKQGTAPRQGTLLVSLAAEKMGLPRLEAGAASI